MLFHYLTIRKLSLCIWHGAPVNSVLQWSAHSITVLLTFLLSQIILLLHCQLVHTLKIMLYSSCCPILIKPSSHCCHTKKIRLMLPNNKCHVNYLCIHSFFFNYACIGFIVTLQTLYWYFAADRCVYTPRCSYNMPACRNEVKCVRGWLVMQWHFLF